VGIDVGKIGELREGYIANWKTYLRDEICVRVARPSVLAPSKRLLESFMKIKTLAMKKGLSELDARKEAWIFSDYEEFFRKEIMDSWKARHKLAEIVKLLQDGKNVRLICYEKEPPCHRFLLMEIIQEMMK